MTHGTKAKKRWGLWILGGGVSCVIILGVLGAVFIPIFITKWLGGDEFRRLASRQVSTLLRTEGEFHAFQWSSFSVYSDGFRSRPGAPGPWIWNLCSLRADISPRLLLDRVLRFSEITVGELNLESNLQGAKGPSDAAIFLAQEKEAGPDIFRDVQVGLVRIQSAQLKPSAATGGWGVENLQIVLSPTKTRTDFTLQQGTILQTNPWLGQLQIRSARGQYVAPVLYLTSMEASSSKGGVLDISGEWNQGNPQGSRGEIRWSDWPIPSEASSLGIVRIQGKTAGNLTLETVTSSGISGRGSLRLMDASFQTDPSMRSSLQGLQSANDFMRKLTSLSIGLKTSTFDVLAGLADDPRWNNARLSTAKTDFQITPGGWEMTNLNVESQGFLWLRGQIRSRGGMLSGKILLGMDTKLAKKVQEFTYGACFRGTEGGYLIEPIEISGSQQSPKNDLSPKLVSAAQRRATEQTARTMGAVLQKISGDQPGNAAGTAGQILNSLFGPPQTR